MNEHDNLTPAELESYRSALKEAYPAPKTDIHANVMKEIRAERLAQAKRRRRAAFVKWGSVAACLVLVCVIALRVAPELDKLAPVAENSGMMAEDASVAAYSPRNIDNDAVAYDVAEENDSVPAQNDGKSYGMTEPYDPKYNGYEVEFPADDGINAELQGGKTPADYTVEHSTSDDAKPEGVMTEAPETEADATEKVDEAEETEETEETEESEESEETAVTEEIK